MVIGDVIGALTRSPHIQIFPYQYESAIKINNLRLPNELIGRLIQLAALQKSDQLFGEMMKKVVTIFLLLSCFPVMAQGVLMQGGSLDCGTWLSARKSNTANHFEHYLLGAIDGLALGRLVDVWGGKGGRVTREQFYYWMDNYCEKNPLDMTITAAVNFADEMSNGVFKTKAKRANP